MTGLVTLCGAILDKEGTVVFIDPSSNETDAWRFYLGWPDKEEIEEAKRLGKRFAIVEVREKAAPPPPPRMSKELEELLEKVKSLPPMTPAQIKEQRRSFVRGQMGLCHPEMSRKEIDDILDQIDP